MISVTFKREILVNGANSSKTIEFHDGQVVGLFGKNGAGKTTLLRSIMGVPPYNAQIEKCVVDGKPFSEKSYGDIAYITDGLYLFDEMNAMEHMKFFKDFYKKFNEERFAKLIDMFELDKNVSVKDYSKGQRSKLELALGFCKGTKYIIMDEPFIGNDPFMRNDFLKIMAGLLEDDSIVIIATHYLEEIENFIDRALFMVNRGIVKDVTMDEIFDSGSNLINTARETFGIDENRVLRLFLEENE